MDVLSSTSLGDMLEKCSDSSGYRGMIVFNTAEGLKDFIREFVSLNRESAIPGVRIVKQNYNAGTIEFTNDSVIQLVVANNSAKGRRCNAILYDEAMNDESVALLNGYLTPYRTDQWEDNNKWASRFMGKWVTDDKLFKIDPMENVTDTKELDSFLNEFAVKS